MIETSVLAEYLDALLEISSISDYPGALNGLQLGNNGNVRKVAAAVDFSSRTAQMAIEQKADLLLVHHGMFWSGAQSITGTRLERLRSLIENNVAVYSSHLPLDCHPIFGNNTLLSRELGLQPTGAFARHDTISIGVSGTSLKCRAQSYSSKHDRSPQNLAAMLPPPRSARMQSRAIGQCAQAPVLPPTRYRKHPT